MRPGRPFGVAAALIVVVGGALSLSQRSRRKRAESRDREARLEELERERRELQRLNQELKTFARAASHDLQEPLRMITSYLHLLSTGYSDRIDPRGREFMDYTLDAARRMQHLVRRLLEYSIAEAGTGLAKQECSLEEVLDQVEQDMALAIKEAGARIIRRDLGNVLADPVLLKQLLQNLLSNALKFRSSERVQVEVRAESVDGFCTITVTDNGVGIPRESLDLVFQPFQRAHDPAEYKGSGLGLAICRKLVQSHGGSLEVQSVEGKGSSFTIRLPEA